jgi:hypothetical protein
MRRVRYGSKGRWEEEARLLLKGARANWLKAKEAGR